MHDEYSHTIINIGDSHGCGSETGRHDGSGVGASGCKFITVSPEGDGYGTDASITFDGNGYGSGFTLYASFAYKNAASGDGEGFDTLLSTSGKDGVSIYE
jgi:hypothetical protein